MSVRLPALSARAMARVLTAVFAMLLGLNCLAPALHAQVATFENGEVTVGGSHLSFPLGMTTDAQGNLYIANVESGAIIKVPPTDLTCATAGDCITVATGSGEPVGIAVDKSGNVYFSEYEYGRILEAAWNGTAYGTPTTIATVSSSSTASLALDSNGDLFIGEDYGRAEELPWNGTQFGALIPVGPTTGTTFSGGTFEGSFGVATDTSGNLYIADEDNAIIKVPASDLTCTTPSDCTVVATGVGEPVGVSVDVQGNLYSTDLSGGGVYETAWTGSGYAAPIQIAQFEDPYAVWAQPGGGIFVSDVSAVTELEPQSVNFGTEEVGTTSAAVTLNFSFVQADTMNSTTPVQVLTQGATGLDFSATSNSCSGSESAGAGCSVVVKFKPLYPGPRHGVVELVDSSNSVIATAYVYGVGKGPEIGFLPSQSASVASGFASPQGVAEDGNGNIFVANQGTSGAGAIEEDSAGTISVIGGTSFSSPQGLAVDGAGNLFVADTNNGAVKEILAAGGYTTVNSLGSGFIAPVGVAVDGAGNVFVADQGNGVGTGTGKVFEILAAGGYTTVVTIGSGFNAPGEVALDGSGDLFVADQGGAAYEVEAVDGLIPASPVIKTLGSGFSALQGMVVDASGNVYAADYNLAKIFEITVASGYTQVNPISSAFQEPVGLAMDGVGNLLVTDAAKGVVTKLELGVPAGLNFATTTTIGTTDTVDGAQSMLVQNIGNDTLSFPILTTGDNPSVAAGFSLDGTTTCPEVSTSGPAGSMATGASCTYAVDFAPTAAGSNSGSVNLTDNNLNAGSPNYAMQTISLSGTGQEPGDVTAMQSLGAAPSPAVLGQTVTLSVAVVDTTNSGTYPVGTVTFTDVVGTNTTTYSANVAAGLATYSYQPAAGAHTVTASFTPTNPANFQASSAGSGVNFTVAAYGPVASFTVTAATTPVYAGVPDTLTITPLDAEGNLVANFSGPVTLSSTDSGATFSSVTYAGGVGTATVTFANAGPQTVTAADSAPTGTSNTVTVQPPPNLVVTTAADDAGSALNCTPQTAPGSGTDAACSLRDAVAFVNNAGVGNITFDTTQFATAKTITLTNGQIETAATTSITGPTNGAVTISGGTTTNLFYVDSGVTLTASYLTVTQGYAASSMANGGQGGAFYAVGNLTLSHVVATNNKAYANGGAIATASGAVVTINDSIFTGNSSETSNGGAINNGNATLVINNSTLSNNTANVSGGAIGAAGTTTITNSTLANNVASTVRGGAIYNTQGGPLTLVQTTVSGNSAGTTGGAIYLNTNASLTLKNSVVGGNSAPSYADINPTGGPGGTYTDDGGNVAAASASGTSAITANLAPLGNYGGAFQTMIPLPGSPAICAGTTSNASGISNDERSEPRSTTYAAVTCVDAGAVQSNYSLSFSIEPAPISPATVIVPGASFQAAVTLDESGSPFAPAVSIPLTLSGNGTLTNGTASTVNGVATYSTLQVSAPGTADMLTANLTLNGALAPPLSLSATSSSFMVGQLIPVVSFTPSPASQVYGTAIAGGSLDATAGYNSSTVTGTIAYTTTVNSTQETLTAGATILPAGTYTITATFTPSDTSTYKTASETATYTVTQSGVTVSAAPVTLIYGNAGTATVNVAGPSGNGIAVPTGTITYSVNGGATQTATLTNGSATLAIPGTLNAGSYTIPVTYSGDHNYQTGSGSVSLTVNAESTSLTLTSTPANPVYGTLVQLHGSFTPATANLPASAFSVILDQGKPTSAVVPAASYSNGTVTATYGQLNAGAHTAQLSFSGTSNYSASTSNQVSITVQQGAPTIAWSPTSPIVYGTTLSALLNATTSYNDQTVQGSFSYTAQVSGGSAVPVTASTVLPVGTYTLTANFSPADTTDYASMSKSVSIVVGRSTLTVTANNATKVYGTANPAFTGSYSGEQNGDTFVETYTTAATLSSNAGTYPIVPSVTGANLSDYTVDVQNGTLTVTKAASNVALTSSTANANLNASVIFTAAVTSATTGTPTGSVEFLDGSTVLGTGPLNTQGVATYTDSTLAAGAHSITAVYSGDANFNASTSVLYPQTVTAPNYTLTATPPSLTLKPGQTGQVTISFLPVGGFTGTVNFACSGLPAEASCSFAPPSLTADGSNAAQSSVLTITTLGSSHGTVALERHNSGGAGFLRASIFFLPGLLFGGFLMAERKKLNGGLKCLLVLLLMASTMSGMIGCGFAGPTTRPGASTVTVTATAATNGASGETQTATFTLTISQ